MNLLLDTHVLIWALMDSSKLSDAVTSHLLNPESEVYVSAVSFWEISIKHSLGKLNLSGVSPSEFVTCATDQVGFSLLDLDARLAAEYGRVPALHPDPFDRMLIHQAVSQDLYMVSVDKRFPAYVDHGLKLIW